MPHAPPAHKEGQQVALVAVKQAVQLLSNVTLQEKIPRRRPCCCCELLASRPQRSLVALPPLAHNAENKVLWEGQRAGRWTRLSEPNTLREVTRSIAWRSAAFLLSAELLNQQRDSPRGEQGAARAPPLSIQRTHLLWPECRALCDACPHALGGLNGLISCQVLAEEGEIPQVAQARADRARSHLQQALWAGSLRSGASWAGRLSMLARDRLPGSRPRQPQFSHPACPAFSASAHESAWPTAAPLGTQHGRPNGGLPLRQYYLRLPSTLRDSPSVGSPWPPGRSAPGAPAALRLVLPCATSP
jgi:hypothetical protein